MYNPLFSLPRYASLIPSVKGYILVHGLMRHPFYSLQVAGVIRGLTSVGRRIRPEALHQLAARVIAGDCQRLRLAAEKDIKEIMQGFAAQVWNNVFCNPGHAMTRMR